MTGGLIGSTESPRLAGAAIAATLAVTAAACTTTAAPSAPESAPPASASPASTSTTEAARRGRTTVEMIEVDGRSRQYRLHVPVQPKNPAPLVVVMHGYGGDAASMEEFTSWGALADQHGVVVMYPLGVYNSFNAGPACCGDAAEDTIDDVKAVGAMIDAAGRRLPVDQSRLYATGFSNGGMMSYRLACDTERFAAIGPVGGGLAVECPSPSPTPVIHIHGLNDTVVRWAPPAGGSDPGYPAGQTGPDRWRQAFNCSPPATETQGSVTTTRATCQQNVELVVTTIDGFGHSWPSQADGVDAAQRQWEFFQKHHR